MRFATIIIFVDKTKKSPDHLIWGISSQNIFTVLNNKYHIFSL